MRLLVLHSGLTTALMFTAWLVSGCSDPGVPKSAIAPPAATASDATLQPSVVGTLPAGPTQEPAATTSPAKSDISKTQQSKDMPLPGQANDHSTLAPNATQKASAKNP